MSDKKPDSNSDFNSSSNSDSETQSASSVDLDMPQQQYLCPICLQSVSNKCYTDPCYHQYCLPCFLQWANHSQRCPLCNAHVTATIHYTLTASQPVRTPLLTQRQTPPTTPARYIQYGRSHLLEQADIELGMRKRESVYRHNLCRVNNNRRMRVSHLGSLKKMIQNERCREWIRRDLRVILGVHHVGFFEEMAVAMVGTGDVAGLEVVLGEKTGRFADELVAFANSSLKMGVYDKYVAYDTLSIS
ncbi:hypothetical protein BX661DRAFT_48199 [Kickxella alabastrina]|uniref:uncharacterized protein n=1 Tax=Kickxella alabastrina TaxID=61397 RepID=UPI00221E9300|nr:uncharacterized protein BX661DRAFT_48199 [Kickxella alabastrina]KAI7824284.1 hypothetical protein BX661DRAFT_48199 [Kickxella alabastrina]